MDCFVTKQKMTGANHLVWELNTLRIEIILCIRQKTWLAGKRADDGAEGLWRIHDDLYDFCSFVNDHPGGREWLSLTKGTDITEAFESHHLSQVPKKMMGKFFVRKARQARNSPFTFHENDFYDTLKKKIYKELPNIPKAPAARSKFLADILFFCYLSAALLAAYFKSFTIGTAAGIFLCLTAVAAHNFFHQRDNFRMYYFDFTLLRSRDWRISHALSHHLYTNTVNDLEISSLEPFLQYLPTKKHFVIRYMSWIYSPLFYAFIYIGQFTKNLTEIMITGQGFTWEMLLPFTVPILMVAITKEVTYVVIMFLWIIVVSSIHFGVVGLNAAHHHPDIFHDGDTPRSKEEMDWGIYQLDAVMDRKDITGSHFLVLTNFGDHALHHLFPTIDHGLLEHMYPVFLETCKEFGIEWKLSSQFELIKGQYRQLAKTIPNRYPPKALVKEN
ncbi:hypothetical protein NQ318_005671 [Aromia moschata]|uniref:Cytochrome b5-related protein n=1 Tax=Aromia moschata TaxID=1265417 RepID=A0AAV8XF69_9CUCU|nr:hypothetical protein NQ318_005671 [Aromia moschata]